ncbi:DUF397 domain-containing protein [Actinomadura yumaensis]
MTVQWRKSSFSGGVNDEHCVELGRLARGSGFGIPRIRMAATSL